MEETKRSILLLSRWYLELSIFIANDADRMETLSHKGSRLCSHVKRRETLRFGGTPSFLGFLSERSPVIPRSGLVSGGMADRAGELSQALRYLEEIMG